MAEAPIFCPDAFRLTPLEARLTAQARAFGAAVLAPRAAQWDREASFPTANYRDMAANGLLGICIPEGQGGLGADYRAYALTAAEKKTVTALCDLIIPADEKSPAASAVGVPHTAALGCNTPATASALAGDRSSAVRSVARCMMRGSRMTCGSERRTVASVASRSATEAAA